MHSESERAREEIEKAEEIRRILEEDENYRPEPESEEVLLEVFEKKTKKKKKGKGAVPLLLVEHPPFFLGGGADCQACRKAPEQTAGRLPQQIEAVCVNLPDGG